MHFQAKSSLKPAGNRRPAGPVAMAMDSDSMTRLSLLKSLSTWQFVSMRAHNDTIWYIKYSSLSLSCFRFVPNYLYCIIHTCIHTHFFYIRIITLTKLYIYIPYMPMYYTNDICIIRCLCVCVFMIVCISFHGIQLQFPFLPMDPGQPPCSGKPRVQPTFTWSDLCVCRWGMIR